jgi:flagellin-like hook-associated protein FlgL
MNLRAGENLEETFASGNTPDLKEGDKLVIDNKTWFVRSIEPAETSNNNVYSIGFSETPGGNITKKWSDPVQAPAPGGTADIIAPGTAYKRVGGLQHMEDTVLSALSRQGTIQYRLETAMKDLETRYEATEQLISKDADIDFAEATVRLNRAQMAYQAAIQSGAMIQRNSLLDYVR